MLALSGLDDDHRFEGAFSNDSEGDPKTMCDVLDRVEKRGKAEGENLILILMQKLFAAGRVEDAQKASNDAAYCAKLLTECGLAG